MRNRLVGQNFSGETLRSLTDLPNFSLGSCFCYISWHSHFKKINLTFLPQGTIHSRSCHVTLLSNALYNIFREIILMCSQGPTETSRGRCISWIWSYRWLWDSWVLGTEAGLSGRAAPVLTTGPSLQSWDSVF